MTYEEALRCVIKGRYAEADEMIIKSLEKQIPKKAEIKHTDGFDFYICPSCHIVEFNPNAEVEYCDGCGQRIYWSE